MRSTESLAGEKEQRANQESSPRSVFAIPIFALIAWMATFLLFGLLKFDLFRSDARSYWEYSQNLGGFNIFHLPAYSIVIGALHALLSIFNPLILMQVINVACWAGAILAVYDIFRSQQVRYVWQGTLLFAIFPLYGVVATVYPIADTPAAFCLVAGIWAYFRNRRWLLILAFGVGLLTHKLIWPFIAIAVLIGLIRRRIPLWSVVLIGMPLVVYMILGAQRY